MVFQAFGYANTSLIISLARQIIILLPLAYVLSRFIGLTGVWIAFPIAETITCVISIFFMRNIYKKEIQYLDPAVIFTESSKIS
jgi:Na+-driven multidrug efflux pump